MAHYMVTVQKVLTGVQLIEADTLDEAFEIAENNEEGWTWQDPDMAFINYDMMSANVM